MAKMISQQFPYGTFECYSERGVLSYLVYRFLPHPNNIKRFLNELNFINGYNPFINNELNNIVLFSELDLGKRFGFGCPDGAIFLQKENKNFMLFFEGKFNEKYETSCGGNRKYNSTIQGQLELRWRAVSLYKKYQIQSVEGEYLKEIEEYRKFYGKIDPFYSQERTSQSSDPLHGIRHLCLKEGVKRLFTEYIDKCDLNNIYFLTISKEERNPFVTLPPSLLPRCYPNTWEEVKSQFCWIAAKKIEEYQED